MNYEEAEKNLNTLITWYKNNSENLNEADTRFKLIDRLFCECLGWNKDDIKLEERVITTDKYCDYVFIDVHKLMIAEAKRENINFEIPISDKNRTIYLLASLCRANDNLKKAVDQVYEYCHRQGVQFGIVTNGHQLIAFVASRNDGQPPLEGKALVFSSLKEMKDNFIDLWQALSKTAVLKNSLYQLLTNGEIIDIPLKLSRGILEYSHYKKRDEFQEELKNLSELIFQDVITEPDIETDFYRYCYCLTDNVSEYNLISKRILETRYSEISNKGTRVSKINSLIEKTESDIKSIPELPTLRPIIIIGDKNVGKTAFIKNFINIEAKDLLNKSINLYIDLQIQGNLEKDLKTFISNEITRQLEENYQNNIKERAFVRGVYRKELENFSKTIYGGFKKTNPNKYLEEEIKFLEEKINNNPNNHIKRSLKHIIKRNKNVVIFLDNADQRSEEDQRQTFLTAQELAQDWGITIFVTMRPEVFSLAKEKGLTKDYYSTVFSIQPPPIDEVIRKRLQFALKLTTGEIKASLLPKNVIVKLNNLKSLIEIHLDAIQNQTEIKKFFENICAGDVTLSLDLLKDTFSNPHVKQTKLLDYLLENGHCAIRFHEFLKGAILGDFNYYQPNKSPIANIFDISSPDGKEHFIIPLLLSYLDKYSTIKDGFVEIRTIYENLQSLGFKPYQINNSIAKCIEKRLIEQHQETGDQEKNKLIIRINSRGAYHLKVLCSDFNYVDAIIIDTPILNQDIKLSDAKTLEEKIKR